MGQMGIQRQLNSKNVNNLYRQKFICVREDLMKTIKPLDPQSAIPILLSMGKQ